MSSPTRLSAQLAATLLTLIAASPAFAQTGGNAANFYRDKQLVLIVGYPPGGGYDTYARVVARHMSKYLPSGAHFVVRNMPGAGSLTAANYLFRSAPRDGSEMAALGREIPTIKLFGDSNVRFEPKELNWIGNAESSPSFCGGWHTSEVTQTKDLFDKPLIVGATGVDSSTATVPFALNALLGTKFRVITGYPGGAAMHLALERGEINGRCAWSWSSLSTSGSNWVEEGKVRVLIGLGLTRDPRLPDVPTAMELTDDEMKKQALELVLSQGLLTRPFAAPPSIPGDRLDLLRSSFDQTMADAEFRHEIERQKLEVSPMTGAEMKRIVDKIHLVSPDVVRMAAESMRPSAQPSQPTSR
jgi:tripartite-type tricarboxylate transporter receptor subunit TctC